MVCKKCGTQVSKNYRICPNCGNDLRRKRKIILITLGVVAGTVLLVAGIVIGILIGGGTNESKPDDVNAIEADPEAGTKKPDGEENDNTATEPVEERKKNPVPEKAAEDACGEDLTWRFDEETATLYIEGEGDMWDFVEWDEDYQSYNFSYIPWKNYSTKIENIIIADGVTSIGDWAFYDCSSLTSIEIPDSVTSIGDGAFCSCSSLTSITIPDSVTSIGSSAFAECSSLESIEIPDSVTSIGDWAFNDCDSLTSIEIPDSVTFIGNCAFYHCTSLESIEIPDSVTSIGYSAFSHCSSLETINFSGTKEQWDSFGLTSEDINGATVYYGK